MSTVIEEQTASDRRAANRRSRPERRRTADSRWPVFEVSRSMLRMALVVRRSGDMDDLVITRSIQWRKDAKLLNTEQGIQELTAAFHTLVNDEKLAGAKIRVVLGGDLCVSRVIAGSAADVRKELSNVEERSQLYLSLGSGRKAFVHSTRQLDARHQLAVLCVASEKTLEILAKVTEDVGIQITSIEPSLIALTRAQSNAGQTSGAPSLLVEVHETGAEIGICRGGQLLLDYRPGGLTGPDKVAGIISLHLKRLERYLARHHAITDASLRDVYLTGEPEAVRRAQATFALDSTFKVHILSPSDIQADWQFSGDAPGTEMTAVLGTALLKYQPDQEHVGPNLMEHLLAQSRAPMRPTLTKSMFPIALVFLLSLVLGIIDWYETRNLAVIRSELDTLAPIQARSDELRLKLARTESLLTELKSIDGKLDRPPYSLSLQRIANCLPREVWINSVTYVNDSTGSLNGASYTDGGVYDFVNSLKEVPEIKDITLKSTGVGQSSFGPTTTFELDFILSDAPEFNENDAQKN